MKQHNLKLYRQNNPDVINAKAAKRRCSKLNATPPWADLKKIRKFYKLAKELEAQDGIKRHVDHIDPLQHHLVCGIHTQENLQILTETENCSKNNKFTPYTIDENGVIEPVEYS